MCVCVCVCAFVCVCVYVYHDSCTNAGDTTPETHFGRLIMCVVMILGTVLVSMLTAVATGFMELNGRQVER